MPNEITIKITGEAGQGMQTIGAALCALFKKCGLHIFANQDYMSRIRGGNNFFQLRISDKPVYTLRSLSDIVIALDKNSVSIHKDSLTKDGVLVLDKDAYKITGNDKKFIDVPMYDMAQKAGESAIFVNSVALGLIGGITGIAFGRIEDVLNKIFGYKDADVIEKNLSAAGMGYDFAVNDIKGDAFRLKEGAEESAFLMNASEAIALGAIKAGCKFYSAYPMSPSTSIMNTIARHSKKFNIIVEQAEDEIAAINMVIGASFAGARSMTSTSGGGFALMVEGISLSAMTETPVVVVDAQRPAPATGFPTRTEQADLDFIIHAGHGEFARVVYAPGTIEEAFSLTMKAFDISEKYQIPALILFDQHMADSYRDIDELKPDKIKVERHIISRGDSKNIKNYLRYVITESGVSPRAVPSWIEDVIYADSDEHTEAGHITESAGVRVKMVEKRFHKKMAGLLKEVVEPTTYNLENAAIILIGFGSTYGVMKEACDSMAGMKMGFIHLSQVWPFPADHIKKALKNSKKVITVENNAGAQLAKLMRRETGLEADASILKFDGRPFDPDILTGRIKEMAR